MAKAMPALAEDRQRHSNAEQPQMDSAADVRPNGLIFLAVKNGLFWGSIALSCAVIYAVVSSVL